MSMEEKDVTAVEEKKFEPFIPHGDDSGDENYVETEPNPDGFFNENND